VAKLKAKCAKDIQMKEMIKKYNDKATNYFDTLGLANPVEVINEELGGETREESKIRRAKEKEKEKPPKETTEPPKKMAKGGSASSRADGCCTKGKTKGTIVMCGGGMMKAKK
jgi:hypothetical protein